ncbi:bem46 protein, variant [Marasmius tenuissimus]|nr:bem46 protein, variant [Marasmius tenuissimus]
MPSLSSVLAKIAIHGQILLIYPAAFETREERRTNYAFPSDLPYEDVELTTSDGVKLKCMLLRAEKRSRTSVESRCSRATESSRSRDRRTNARATVLMFHGNGYHIWHHAYSGVKFLELGCDVLLVSYRGYGESGGTPSEKGLKKDSQAALDYVVAHPELNKRPIIVHGHSLGGAVSIDLAQRNPDKIHGIILENTFLSIPAVAKDLPGIRHLTFAIHQTWESQRRIASIPRSIPILMFSGLKDEVVPAAQMEKLWEISRTRRRKAQEERGSFFGLGSKLFKKTTEEEAIITEDDNTTMDIFKIIPDGTHADTWIQPGYWETVHDFLTTLRRLTK